MRVVRIIPITDVKPRTFGAWAIKFNDYLMKLPGDILHVVFDEYSDEIDLSQPPKGRPVLSKRRHLSDLTQSLPKASDWLSFQQ